MGCSQTRLSDFHFHWGDTTHGRLYCGLILHHVGLATWLVLTNEMLVDVRHTQAGNVPMNLALLPCHCSQGPFRTRHTGKITCPGWSKETGLGIKLKPEVQLRGSWPTDLWAQECTALRLSVWGKFCYPALLWQELTNTQGALVVWGGGSCWRMYIVSSHLNIDAFGCTCVFMCACVQKSLDQMFMMVFLRGWDFFRNFHCINHTLL